MPGLLIDPAAQGRYSDDPFDLLAPERFARRSTEVDVGGHDAPGLGIRGHEPEHGVGTCEGLVDGGGVTVRSLDDLDALEDVCRELRGVPDDDTDSLAAGENILEHLMADQARRCSEYDHFFLPFLVGQTFAIRPASTFDLS